MYFLYMHVDVHHFKKIKKLINMGCKGIFTIAQGERFAPNVYPNFYKMSLNLKFMTMYVYICTIDVHCFNKTPKFIFRRFCRIFSQHEARA